MRSPAGVLALGVGDTARGRAGLSDIARQQFDVDGMHSSVDFLVTLLRFVKVRGRFRSYDVAMT